MKAQHRQQYDGQWMDWQARTRARTPDVTLVCTLVLFILLISWSRVIALCNGFRFLFFFNHRSCSCCSTIHPFLVLFCLVSIGLMLIIFSTRLDSTRLTWMKHWWKTCGDRLITFAVWWCLARNTAVPFPSHRDTRDGRIIVEIGWKNKRGMLSRIRPCVHATGFVQIIATSTAFIT